MRSVDMVGRGACALVALCVALLAACAGVPGAGRVSATPTIAPVFATLTALPNLRTPIGGAGSAAPPSVAVFCPSAQALASILGETMNPDFTTGTHGATTTCGYKAPTGDTCEFSVTAWADTQSAKNNYTSLMNDAAQVGGHVQALTGLGDAAFYWVDEDITVLKGSYDFFDKCYFLPPRRQTVDERVDLQIAQLLVGRI